MPIPQPPTPDIAQDEEMLIGVLHYGGRWTFHRKLPGQDWEELNHRQAAGHLLDVCRSIQAEPLGPDEDPEFVGEGD